MQVGVASALEGASQVVRRGKSIVIAREQELQFISFHLPNRLELRRKKTCGVRSEVTVAETVDHRGRGRFLRSDVVRRDPVNVLRCKLRPSPTSIVRFRPEKQQLPNL